MKIIKKLFSVILVATMVFTTFSIGITATAESATTETGTTANSPLEVVVTTNKPDYGKFDVAEITVTVTNTGYGTVENASVQAVFDDLAPVDSSYSELSKKVETLEPGESFSFSYKAMLNYKSSNVDFFSKIILWFVWLFNDGYTVVNGNSEADIENVIQIKFGKVLADNVVKVTYTDSTFSDEELKQMQEADSEIDSLIESDEFVSLSKKEKINTIKNYLMNLAKNGTPNMPTQLLIPESIYYDEKTEIVYFKYANGVCSGILVRENNNMLASQPENKVVSTSSTKYGNNSDLNSIIMYGWDDASTTGSSDYPYYNDFAKEISRFGINSTIFTHPSVEDFKTALLNMDFIYIAEHGTVFYDEDLQKELCCFGVYGDEVSLFEYIFDIGNKNIYKLKNASLAGEAYHDLYLIAPKFFEYYYKDKLKDSIVYAGICQSFGADGTENYSLASAFYDVCGADVVVGFHNYVYIGYSQAIMKNFTLNMLCGSTPSEALNMATDKCGSDDIIYMTEHYSQYDPVWWNTPDVNNKTGEQAVAEKLQNMGAAYTCIYGNKQSHNLIAKGGTLSGTVKDETTGNAISGVRVEFIDNSTDSLDPVATTTTDENGLFSVNLPYGSYSLSFNHDNYEYYGTTVNVDTENVVITEPIQLKPNTQYCSITGTVKNKETENIISGVTVELVNSESGSKIVTTTTDENGQFTIKFPYGDYSLKFIHNDYMSASTTVSVKSQSEAMIAKLRFRMSAVSLTPKNQSDTVEYNGHKYKLFDLNMSWEEAKLYCENLGGHLVTITSQEEQNQVSSLLSNGYMMSYWMGGYLLNSNWVWITGEKFEYTYWYPGEPNYSGKYIQIFSSSSGHDEIENGWDNTENEGDLGGGIKLENIGFVCEWDDTNITEKIIIDSGSCGAVGDNITWTFYDDGELAINGNGAMADYQSWADIPWHIYEDQIEIVTIGNRITRIGKMAFADCSNLQKIEIGNSVESIGVKALSATGLTDISIPDSVRTIEDSAFFGCSYLTNIVLGNNVMIIGQMTFQRCVRLSSITIPKSLSSIGSQAFYMCDSLKNVYYKGTSTNWANIGMGSYNTALTNATIHYNS